MIVSEAIDALSRLSAETSSGWQPIETAPKDRRPVEVYVPVNQPIRRILICEHSDQYGWAICGGAMLLGKPTHWRPLPEPPKDQK